MQSILEKIDICKLGGIDKQKLPLWVYLPLRIPPAPHGANSARQQHPLGRGQAEFWISQNTQ